MKCRMVIRVVDIKVKNISCNYWVWNKRGNGKHEMLDVG